MSDEGKKDESSCSPDEGPSLPPCLPKVSLKNKVSMKPSLEEGTKSGTSCIEEKHTVNNNCETFKVTELSPPAADEKSNSRDSIDKGIVRPVYEAKDDKSPAPFDTIMESLVPEVDSSSLEE